MQKQSQLLLLRQVLDYGYKVSDEHLFWCKQCPTMHHKPKLSINIDKNAFKCWVCGFRGDNLYYLLKRYGDFTLQQEWLSVSGEDDIDQFNLIFGNNEEIEIIETKVELPKEYLNLSTYKQAKHYLLKKAYQYLISDRGLTHSEIVRWRLGCCIEGYYKDRIIFPSLDDKGEVNYFIARSFGKAWPSYKNPTLSKSIIFNDLEVDWEDEVVLVEGAFDSIKYPGSVPLLGSSMNEEHPIFKKILENKTKTFIALDQDALSNAVKIIEMFLSYGTEIYIVDTRGYEDVAVMSKEIFEEKKKEAELITWDNILLLKSSL